MDFILIDREERKVILIRISGLKNFRFNRWVIEFKRTRKPKLITAFKALIYYDNYHE